MTNMPVRIILLAVVLLLKNKMTEILQAELTAQSFVSCLKAIFYRLHLKRTYSKIIKGRYKDVTLHF